MFSKYLLFFNLFIVVGFCPGCMTIQLQRLSNRQAKTLSEVYEKQVLDNLAMVVVDANATPFFSVAGQATNEVGASGEIGAGAGAFVFQFWEFFSAGSSREAKLSWAMNPVIDPNRLRLMQCAYQRAVGVSQDSCQQCCEIEQAWYGPDYDCNDPCGITCGWLRKSNQWKDVPKCCRSKFGHHCGIYVWVDPCRSSEFSRLVMRIVEYASSDKDVPFEQLKEVKFYLKQNGSLGSLENHSTVITAMVDGSKSLEQIQREFGMLQALKVANAEDRAAVEALQNKDDDYKLNAAEIQNAKRLMNNSGRSQGTTKLEVWGEDNIVLDKQTRADLDALKTQLEMERDALNGPYSAPAPRKNINFGLPTQLNSQFGGGLLQLRQQLDAGRTR